jgi:hypothetical protein
MSKILTIAMIKIGFGIGILEGSKPGVAGPAGRKPWLAHEITSTSENFALVSKYVNKSGKNSFIEPKLGFFLQWKGRDMKHTSLLSSRLEEVVLEPVLAGTARGAGSTKNYYKYFEVGSNVHGSTVGPLVDDDGLIY